VISPRRRDANRRNARASTGPRTSTGKARAAQNARRHGLSLPARYDPSRWDGIEALARAIAATDADAECLELARRIAEAQIDIIRARAARRDLFPASPAALLEPGAITRLAAIDRYERRAWSRRKRAIRAFDDAHIVERAGDFAARLAERSQLPKAEQAACVSPAPRGAGSQEPERGASPEAASANLAERSQGETFRVETPARHFGRTKPIAAGLLERALNSGCHRPSKRTIRYPPNAARGTAFSAGQSGKEDRMPSLPTRGMPHPRPRASRASTEERNSLFLNHSPFLNQSDSIAKNRRPFLETVQRRRI
jgi:hypothetical protein